MKKLILAGLLLGSVVVANATSYVYDFTFDGTTSTTNQTAAGSQLEVGDMVTATFNAFGNGYWSANAGTHIWTPILVYPAPGTRIGDLYWTFLMDGSVIDSGSLIGESSESVHIPGGVTTSSNINFDKLQWQYTLTSTNVSENQLQGLFFYEASLSPAEYHVDAPVPEPSTFLLLGAGLGGFALYRRRMKK